MNKTSFLSLGFIALLASCNPSKSIHKIPVPENTFETINVPAKQQEMYLEELQKWPQVDLATDSIPGMSIEKAYEFLADKKGETVIVGVIDSGIDITHEDLKDNVWTNIDEIPNNGKDDDKNGYVDDINGWNFLGGPEGTANPEQLELTRLYAALSKTYDGVSEEEVSESQQKEYVFYKELKAEFNEKNEELQMNVSFFSGLLERISKSDAFAQKELNKSTYSIDELKTLPQDKIDPYLIKVVAAGRSPQEFIEKLQEGKDYYKGQADFNYNLEFNGRKTNDDVTNLSDVPYGNNYVIGSLEDEMHGTHVSGIGFATRNNGAGMNGVAQNVQLLSVRAIPDGDEYDKDVALAIRYAVDNGAKVINMSFGKSYSPNAEWVYDAIKYAEKHDVLLVHAAGNDAKNIDKVNNFPTDAPDKITEIVDNVITIGSITKHYDKNLVSSFSNYGRKNVDIFAPGSEIYSTVPNNEYESIQGTSMAAPAVAGVAALIRSYYPELSASQVKHIIMNSGTKVNFDVLLPGGDETLVAFKDLSVSGSILNAYNALVLANQIVNQK
ncbi:S8 family peptidase [Urechidicola vernalis]|uniref:S8 family peptidase n=1 Tax=Urechidicola vernalis TaxID=3075600 RepID=A0ABU2Y584_9FLAO|nr:S8 family peptidase [Urechidicola sp. P050]MDT0553336.1 S8 family peptidase [Urechidicola sp. P050]